MTKQELEAKGPAMIINKLQKHLQDDVAALTKTCNEITGKLQSESPTFQVFVGQLSYAQKMLAAMDGGNGETQKTEPGAKKDVNGKAAKKAGPAPEPREVVEQVEGGH